MIELLIIAFLAWAMVAIVITLIEVAFAVIIALVVSAIIIAGLTALIKKIFKLNENQTACVAIVLAIITFSTLVFFSVY